jgi:hypothetical protein
LLKGSIVGPLATKWLGRERNVHLAYHTHFWAHVLGKGLTPIRVRAGDQWILIDPDPLKIHLDLGIQDDTLDLKHELEEAEDPDEGLDLDEDAEDEEEEWETTEADGSRT